MGRGNFGPGVHGIENRGVKWFPRGSSEAREEWAKSHPWLAGTYFGFFMALAAALLQAPLLGRIGMWTVAIAGLGIWVLTGLLFAIGLKLGWEDWSERPGAEDHPAPSIGRPWSRLADRLLVGFLLFGAGGVASSIIVLVTGSQSRWTSAI